MIDSITFILFSRGHKRIFSVTIVIIMPTYNEASNIGRMIDVLFMYWFPRIGAADLHLLVVDDNSPDGTGEIVRNKMERFSKLYLHSGERKGLGAAYVRGMTYAMHELHADAVIEMDADFQHDPRYIQDFVSEYINGADYVVGSRFIKGGSIPSDWAWYRRAVSYFGNRFAKAVLRLPDVHDITTGFRLTRVNGILDQINLNNLMAQKRFAYKVDLLCRTVHLSTKTVEFPIAFHCRNNETSKFSLMEILATLKVVMVLGIKPL